MDTPADGADGGGVDLLYRPGLGREEKPDQEGSDTMSAASDPWKDILEAGRRPAPEREAPRLVKDGERDSMVSRALGKEPAEPSDDAGRTAAGEDAGPDYGGPYQAFGRSRNYELPALVLYFNAFERRSYGKKKMRVQYEQIESDDPMSDGFAADGQSFSFVVAGAGKARRVTVKGRELERGYDLITLRRMPWIRSADRDFGHRAGEIITSVEVTELEKEW